jgi:DNA-binding response OmpR family regulator
VNKLVLLIEDDPMFRLSIFEFLESQNFNVISTEDGMSGLQLAQEFHPDLIVCDINLPHLNGFDILNKVRGDLATAKTPFIFLTSETDPDSRRRAMQLGANDYLTKPVSLNQLLKSITINVNQQDREN